MAYTGDLGSLIDSSAVASGIPPAWARGLFQQESGMGTTSPNIGQVLGSTAANPGYGLAPLQDPNDPTQAVPFSLAYLRAKANANGLTNMSDPAQFAQALQGYNGGGDPNYVQHVASRIPGGLPGVAMGGNGISGMGGSNPLQPPVAGSGPYQSTPLPPMPANFAQSNSSTANPSTPAQVDMSGHVGDSQIAMGLAMMGGNGWHDAMAKGGEAYAAAQARSLGAAQLNAQLQNDAMNRDADAPSRAAQAAAERAKAWEAMNPDHMTPVQAAQLNNSSRATDAQMFDAQQAAQARAQMMQFQQNMMRGQPKQYVVPSDDPTKPDQNFTQSFTKDGQMQVLDANGKPATMPDNAMPLTEYQMSTRPALAQSEKDLSKMGLSAQLGAEQQTRINDAQSAVANPGANVTPGLAGKVGRGIDAALGTNLFGNLSDTQVAQKLLEQETQGQIGLAAQSQGGSTDASRAALMQALPHIGDTPAAMQQVMSIMKGVADRKVALSSAWRSLSPQEQYYYKTRGGVNTWAAGKLQELNQAAPPVGTPPGSPGAAPATAAAPQGSSIAVPPPPVAPAAPAAPGTSGNPIDLNKYLR